jgi:hypothetical protein
MKKYPFDCYGIDQYIYAVNRSAWSMLNRADRAWPLGTEPVFPLNWYISSGRAPTPFIKTMLSIRPDVIARVLVSGGSDQEIIAKIKAKVERRCHDEQ